MSLLEIRKLGKTISGMRILNDISFSLEKGETLSIIGSSGSGKTTLLRCISFLEQADEGVMLLNGELIYDAAKGRDLKEKDLLKIRRHFGLV
ncbi:MAG: amino acid ABC transporter ATP-binding protein, partial [Erysipelotrichaceae bacterium]|nr:amino acid ABC transporter ATP-binding protein [Erysipelotrichaceae bacterium]